MLYGFGLVGIAVLFLWVFCLYDVITTDPVLVRNAPKGFWILIVLILPTVGSALWLIAGRPRVEAGPRPRYAPGFPEPERDRWLPASSTRAPDDDPEFLRELKRGNDAHERMLRQWEDDLRRREEELRRRGTDPAD